jgi:hypothetical protein
VAGRGKLLRWGNAEMVRSHSASCTASGAGAWLGHSVVEVDQKRAPGGSTERNGAMQQQEPTVVVRWGGEPAGEVVRVVAAR